MISERCPPGFCLFHTPNCPRPCETQSARVLGLLDSPEPEWAEGMQWPEPTLPSALAQAGNFVAAQVDAALTGWQQVDAETKASRLAICEACVGPGGYFRPSDRRCAACGCYADFKVLLKSASCPVGKWPAVDAGGDPVGGCGGVRGLNTDAEHRSWKCSELCP